jgi:hypothetical protein
MRSLSQMHDYEGDCCSQTGCEPLKARIRVVSKVELEDCCDNNTD